MSKFRKQQKHFRERAEAARRGVLVWPSSKGTYDPFGKVKAAWANWAKRRKERNDRRRKQLAISRGETDGDRQTP